MRVRVGVKARVPVDDLAWLHAHHGRHVPHLGRVRVRVRVRVRARTRARVRVRVRARVRVNLNLTR